MLNPVANYKVKPYFLSIFKYDPDGIHFQIEKTEIADLRDAPGIKKHYLLHS